MNTCHLCQTAAVRELINCGMQPICNRFLTNPSDAEYTHPMVIGQCDVCGLMQISHPVPAEELRPRNDRNIYNEPDRHLDQLAEIIFNLPGVTTESSICGITSIDEPLLQRMKEKGCDNVWQLDLREDLEITDHRAGVETIQQQFDRERASAIARVHAQPDVIVVRYILEHAHNLLKLMTSLKQLVKPEGYIIFEVPNCERGLATGDYSLLWEEHIFYFTPETFRHCFAFAGFSLIRFESYPSPQVNCLVGIAQPQKEEMSLFPPAGTLSKEQHRAQTYAQKLPEFRDKLKKFLSEYPGKTVLFGAGHLACTFINLLNLKEHIEFVVDDHPKKQGLFMPGSQLPIYGSAALGEPNIKLCLLSLSPESQDKVIHKNQAFVARGGTFSSIFPDTKYALLV